VLAAVQAASRRGAELDAAESRRQRYVQGLSSRGTGGTTGGTGGTSSRVGKGRSGGLHGAGAGAGAAVAAAAASFRMASSAAAGGVAPEAHAPEAGAEWALAEGVSPVCEACLQEIDVPQFQANALAMQVRAREAGF
jgi:hypothetical protein